MTYTFIKNSKKAQCSLELAINDTSLGIHPKTLPCIRLGDPSTEIVVYKKI